MSKQEKANNDIQEEENQDVQNEHQQDSKETEDQQDDSNSESDELVRLEMEKNELNDKYLRLYSEFDNFRRRTAKEKIDLINHASEDLMKRLLPVLDDFERAVESNKKVEDIDQVKEGFTLIQNKLKHILESKGLKHMDSAEKDFNVDHHEAITRIPAPSDDLKGKVVDVVEPGYLLNDKVIRYAKVVIGE